jgi:TolB-like protein
MMFRFADHELDLRRHELRRAGEVVHIEPQVFDLLAFLLRNRDRIVSKDEILDAVWDGRIVSEAALSSRINAARKAIGDTGNDQALIRTFHKRGFRFVAHVRDEAPDEVAAPLEGSVSDTREEGTRLAHRVREKPSVAVIPFTHLSSDSEQDYFSYGLTEDLVRLLGRNRWLKVLSRHSARPDPMLGTSARELGDALGVQYLVQGSLRRAGDHLRIAVELIETHDGSQLWSEVYELDLQHIFDIQAAMAQQLAAALEPELGMVEREAAVRKPSENLDAWDCYQRGFWHLWGFTRPGFDEAELLFRRAVELDSNFARAHAALSYVQLQKAFYSPPQERPALLEGALASGRVSVALDQRDCMCHCVLGRAHCLLGNYSEAIAELELTVALNPSFAQGYFALAFALNWVGRQEEAIALLERAGELSPRDPHLWSFYHVRALAHLSLGELEAAQDFARRAIRQPNATYWPYATLLATHGLLSDTVNARPILEQLLQHQPDYTCSFARQDFFYCTDEEFVNRYVEGLRRAGVPE